MWSEFVGIWRSTTVLHTVHLEPLTLQFITEDPIGLDLTIYILPT